MIIVTGANGFIGSMFIWELNQKGVSDIVAVDSVPLSERNLIKDLSIKKFIHKNELFTYLQDCRTSKQLPRWIVHMGACSTTTERNWDFLKENNLEYSKRIWEFCTLNQIPLIYASSAATYGAGELGFDDGIPAIRLKSLNLYGESKRLFDVWVQEQNKDFCPPYWYGLKFFNVFGPRERHKGTMSSLVYKSYNQILEHNEMGLFKSYRPDFADGEQKRDFIYIKDVTLWMWELMQKKPVSDIYNMGFSQARTWIDLARGVFAALREYDVKYQDKIKWLEMPEELKNQYQYFTEANMTKWFQVGMSKPKWNLENAIKDYVKTDLIIHRPLSSLEDNQDTKTKRIKRDQIDLKTEVKQGLKDKLPTYLQKYIVDQNYNKYTPVDQAIWRFILKQLRHFLSNHAHECYLDGLEKTGIKTDTIPNIQEMSSYLEKFGWKALPVSGFIPPAAFMELQSLGILPIASDLRSADHLMYTPAPDIVHEAAGHAPILIHPEFAAYLKKYATVAKKAIISREDMDIYEAIRNLSDLKENPNSTQEQIKGAEKHLAEVSKNVSHVSEATELSRMNWWTAEYGLIGDMKNPKIYGAGLLSSVGESQWCLSDKVKKIPFSIDCIRVSYDITEPQPQLFVARDFQQLHDVLDQLAARMAYKTGGIDGLNKVLLAQTVNTVQLETGLQISGILSHFEVFSSKRTPGEKLISFIKLSGPCQISWKDREITGHGKSFHNHGYSTPLGVIENSECKPSIPAKAAIQGKDLIEGKTQLSTLLKLQEVDWTHAESFDVPSHMGELKLFKLNQPKKVNLNFASGIHLEGDLHSGIFVGTDLLQDPILMTFSKCRVTFGNQTLFEPSWGTFDLALGSKVTSVYGGAADRQAFGESEDFIVARVPEANKTQVQIKKNSQYQTIREIRNLNHFDSKALTKIQIILNELNLESKKDWLLYLEIYEVLLIGYSSSPLIKEVLQILLEMRSVDERTRELIDEGLKNYDPSKCL